jgi:hypothetical protein
MDVSGSVDAADYALRVTGYANAFANPALVTAIEGGAIGSIAVTLFQFSDSATQSIGWTLVDDAASASALSASIAAMARDSSGGTNIIDGINDASASFAGNGFEGTREVIDVSGDGAQSPASCNFDDLNCVALQVARDAFLGGGTNRTINALWIDDRDFFGDDPADQINALDYGNLNVIGGPSAFQGVVDDFEQFEAAIDRKIIREVTQAPEPGTLLLLGGALFAVSACRRNRRA